MWVNQAIKGRFRYKASHLLPSSTQRHCSLAANFSIKHRGKWPGSYSLHICHLFGVLFLSCSKVADWNPSNNKVRDHSRGAESSEWNSMTLSAMGPVAWARCATGPDLNSFGLLQISKWEASTCSSKEELEGGPSSLGLSPSQRQRPSSPATLWQVVWENRDVNRGDHI